MAVIKLNKKKIEEILSQRLGLESPVFHLESAGGRFVGHVISPTFKGKRDFERQSLIWDALDAELGAQSVARVGMLLAYTPEEWKLGEDDKPATKKRKKAG